MLAVETGIAPLDLLETPNDILESMADYLNEQAEHHEDAERRAHMQSELKRMVS